MEQNTENKQTNNNAPDEAVGVERMVRPPSGTWLSNRHKSTMMWGCVYKTRRGLPKETDAHTQEELIRMGYEGIYVA